MRYGEDAKFIDTLLNLRKRHDLVPWALVQKAQLPNDLAAGYAFHTQFRQADEMLVSEITHLAQRTQAGITNEFLYETNWKQLIGPTEVEQQRRAFLAESVFGSNSSSWIRLGRGFLFKGNQTLRIDGRTVDQIFAGDQGVLVHHILRGYKLLPQGSLSIPQRTVKEWMAQGRKLGAYKEGVSFNVAADTSSQASSATLNFDADTVIESISMTTRTTSNVRFNIEVKVKGEREFSSDFAPYLALAGNRQETRWDFPLPVTVKKGTEWTFDARRVLAGAAPLTLDVVLHSYRM